MSADVRYIERFFTEQNKILKEILKVMEEILCRLEVEV